MNNFRISVKAMIINKGKLLVLKRDPKDVQKPGIWEPPGGRIELGEDPFIGLKRECFEEINIHIEIQQVLNVRHFTRTDGQKITMLLFYCTTKENDIKLSSEHTDYKWLPLESAKDTLAPFFHPELDIYLQLQNCL